MMIIIRIMIMLLTSGTVRVAYEAVQGVLSPLDADLGLASPGQDFIAITDGIVDMPDGVTSAIVNVTIIDDLMPEIDEIFLVRLTSVSLVGLVDETSPPRLAESGTEAEVKIGANDGAQGVIVFGTDSRKYVTFALYCQRPCGCV